MSREDRLDELLDLWEEAREQGRPASPEELCHHDFELLRDLRKRIGELQAVERFLQPAAPSAVVDLEAIPAGRYRPLRLHAHGGLGEVFIAEDAELNREVALKRLKPHRAWDRDSQARFLHEAELTARLDHPGIVPVYGLGHDTRGQLYYAMRLVAGRTLDEAISQFHDADQPGRDPGERSLAFAKLLRAFLSVCQTVAFAHSRQVLHRDLKPANILLGDYGETLLIDWGLAKTVREPRPSEAEKPPVEPEPRVDRPGETTTDGFAKTQPGQAKGTPAYMSPEQAAGNWDRVGPTSDVYSLGATLYKLLTGRVAFDGQSREEVFGKVQRGEFAWPRQVRAGVPPALEAVCLEAMALRPEDRYGSALELAADVEHWLADEPVSAWREPWTLRGRRWLRRHRAWATASVVGLVIIALAAAALAAQSWRNAEAERVKNEELRRAYAKLETAKGQVDRSYTHARQAIRDLAASALGNPQLARANLIGFPEDMSTGFEDAEEGLVRARAALRTLLEDRPDGDWETSWDLGRIGLNLGQVRLGRGKVKPAREALAEARKSLEGLRKPLLDNPDLRMTLALVDLAEGRLHLLAGGVGRLDPTVEIGAMKEQAEQAAPFLERARVSLEKLRAEQPSNPGVRYALASAWQWLGVTKYLRQQYQDALPWFEKAQAALDDLRRQFPKESLYRNARDRAQYALGNCALCLAGQRARERNFEETVALVEKAQLMLRPLVPRRAALSGFPEVYQAHRKSWGALLQDQAVAALEKKQTTRLWRLFDRAIPVWEEWDAVAPGDKDVQQRLNWLRVGLAETSRDRVLTLNLARAEDRAEARRLLSAALAALKRLPAGIHTSAGVVQLEADLQQRLTALPRDP